MSKGETSKQRSARIPLDYYKRPDRLTRWKNWLALALALVAVVWTSGLGWDIREWPRRGVSARALATHGTLARVHATWDTDCDACHKPFQPIDGSNWAARLIDADGRGLSDRQCQACHAGPPHHADKVRGDTDSCAGCHRDHGGRDASLVALDDRQCTRCHGDLAAHRMPAVEATIASSVTRFDTMAGGHPEFRAIGAKDPGHIAFNHALHLAEGLTLVPGGRPKTLDDLATTARDFYQDATAKSSRNIQLRCDSCHSLDRARSSAVEAGVLPTSRAYMLPVRFEAHCQACHTLDFDPDLPPMRHGLQPAGVIEDLWQAYAAQFLKGRPDLKEWRPPVRPIPGRDQPPEIRAANEAIDRKVATAERILFGEKKCGECHTLDLADGRRVERNPPDSITARPAIQELGHRPESATRESPASSSGSPPTIPRSNIPTPWFAHARFDHSAHRAVDCRACHGQAWASRSSQDVLLPGISVCRQCHAPRSERGATVSGGAGFSCTECHRYHTDATSSHGQSSRPEAGSTESSIRRFLLGHPERE